MELEPMDTLKQAIEALAAQAQGSASAHQAMQFTQAALNLAHAYVLIAKKNEVAS